MIVEFVGPAASGKSTLRRRVEEALKEESLSVATIQAAPRPQLRSLRGMTDQAISVLSQPALSAWSIRNIGDRRRQNRLLTTLRRSYNVRRALRRPGSDAEVIIIDEGPWRVAPRMLGEGVKREERLLHLLPWPDVFVFVTADVEDTIQRHYERGRGLAKRPHDFMRKSHTDQLRGLETVLIHRPSIRVNTSQQREETVKSVVSFLLGNLRGGPSN